MKVAGVVLTGLALVSGASSVFDPFQPEHEGTSFTGPQPHSPSERSMVGIVTQQAGDQIESAGTDIRASTSRLSGRKRKNKQKRKNKHKKNKIRYEEQAYDEYQNPNDEDYNDDRDDSYSAPKGTGYSAPSSGYNAPSSGYNAPSSGYDAPSYNAPSYNAPSYNAPSYGGGKDGFNDFLNALAAFLPIGLFLAAIPPNLITISTGKRRKRGDSENMIDDLSGDVYHHPFIDRIKDIGLDKLNENSGCQKQLFCEMANYAVVGENPNWIQSVFHYLSIGVANTMDYSLGDAGYFDKVRSGKCLDFGCGIDF